MYNNIIILLLTGHYHNYYSCILKETYVPVYTNYKDYMYVLVYFINVYIIISNVNVHVFTQVCPFVYVYTHLNSESDSQPYSANMMCMLFI